MLETGGIEEFELWDLVHSLFDEDDGSLPEIRISELTPTEVCEVYSLVRSHSELPGDAIFWDKVNQCDTLISSVADPAKEVVEYRADPFAHEAVSFRYCGLQLPHLAVFVFEEQVDLFYRAGGWETKQVLALFSFLSHIQSLAPAAKIQHEYEGLTAASSFARAWSLFYATGRSSK